MPKLVVQIPAYNEAATIKKVISAIPREIAGVDNVFILVLDDGSHDQAAQLAKEAGADLVISNEYNIGLGANFKKGLDTALKLGADIVVNIDGDHQFDPTQISLLITPLLEHKADLVIGSRFLDKKNALAVPFIKRWPNIYFSWIISKITRQKLSDAQCGFRAYSREAALRLNLFGQFTYTQELLIDLLDKGLIIKEVPIKVVYYPDRHSVISGNLIMYGFRSLGLIAMATRDARPLEFFGWPGFLFFTLGLVGGLWSFIYWLTHLATSPIKTLLLVSIFLMTFGTLLIIFGLLAEMIKRNKKIQEEILYQLKKERLEKKI